LGEHGVNNVVIGALGVTAVVGVLSQGYLSQLRDHIKNALRGNVTSGIDNTLSIQGNPSDLGTGAAPQLPGQSTAPFLSNTAAGMPGQTGPQMSDTGQPVVFSPGTLTLNLTSKGMGYVAIPDNTSTDNIYIPGAPNGGIINNWRQYLVSPLIPGQTATRKT
jgi:hypothetical protein